MNKLDIESNVNTEYSKLNNDKTKKEIFYYTFIDKLYRNYPEKIISFNNIKIGDGLNLQGYEIDNKKIKILVVDYGDYEYFDTKIIEHILIAINKSKEEYSSLEQLEKDFDYDDYEYNFYTCMSLENIKNIEIDLFTNAKIETTDEYTIMGMGLRFGIDINFFDMSKIEKIGISQTNDLTKEIKVELEDKIENYSYVSGGDVDVFLFAIKAVEIANMYKEFEVSLLQDNVRLFLATSKINKAIVKSVSENPDYFLSFNNGISAVCDSVEKDSNKISKINGLQIVNGGQTTASIFEASKNNELPKNSFVQFKLTVVKNDHKYDDIVRDIAKYANSQNKVNNSDFYAANSFFVEMEKIANVSEFENKEFGFQKIFIERMRGQYKLKESEIGRNDMKNYYAFKTDLKEISQLFNNWYSNPEISSRGGEKSLEYFMSNIINYPSDINTFKRLVAIKKITEYLLEQIELSDAPGDRFKVSKSAKNFGPVTSRIRNYTLSILGTKYNDDEMIEKIYSCQKVNDVIKDKVFLEYISLVWDHFKDVPDINEHSKKEECKKIFFDNLK